MLKTAALAALCCVVLSVTALACTETGSVTRPSCMGNDFLAGIRSIKVTMHRVGRQHGVKTGQKVRPHFIQTNNINHLGVKSYGRPSGVIGGRPAGCPHAWCGCYLARYFGLTDKGLWIARKWALIGHPAQGPQTGAIVVWRHHVGLIRAVEGRRILVLSGNDGHAVRERWRTTLGVIAYRVAGG